MCTSAYVFNFIDGRSVRFRSPSIFKRLTKSLAEEWDNHYPTVRGSINARISITQLIVRATNRCIRGSKIPVNRTSNIKLVGKEVQDLDFRKMIEVYRRQQPNCAEAKRIRSGLTANTCAFASPSSYPSLFFTIVHATITIVNISAVFPIVNISAFFRLKTKVHVFRIRNY